MADRFYVNCPLAPGAVSVDGREVHHLATVCRLGPGDRVRLFNGDGNEYLAEVTGTSRHEVTLHVLSVESTARELGFRLEVAAPLPKGDRGHFLVEKLTELGVSSFIPLRTRRSVVHPGDSRLEKLQRYVIEASKQCGRNVLLRVEPVVDWPTYCGRAGLPATRVLAQPGGTSRPWQAGQDVAVAVGPEGGFTDEEVAAARAAGWDQVGLGPRVLRVETAALVLAVWAASSGLRS
ncbi:MAG TPA: RsmE family RNA methyltransferase [Gemmataceae bacterium]|jgi:16S rRNA (uracil1498-N3)-methyltransferase|nr:RsmE family RNA methyltransferase [Gemmataceae bacterium]